ncbi:hypothetical protein [Allorhodopirellula heiligendammensis]|uniref:Uncharacterized protein n=1 Tax=Allorhodopirellula heiligendammensis TaxID=2714739 RepID=A0A5C6C4N3_9BACT|nr:hypothetical protein [Allorhodopirellula heiligendammensis]TWU18501.1 hypothetical protein Poly21_06640 [Allorhodopirellula heiligendammensis]
MSDHTLTRESPVYVLLRFLIYGLFAIVMGQIIVWNLNSLGVAALASENGVLEWVQVAFLAFASGLSACAFCTSRSGSTIYGLIACVTAYATAKECDTFFEAALFDDAYKYVAGVPLALLAGFLLYRGRMRFVNEISECIGYRWFGIFVTAGILLASLCQLLDSAHFWETFEQSLTLQDAKRLVEETSELYAYYFMSVAAVESFFQSRILIAPTAS